MKKLSITVALVACLFSFVSQLEADPEVSLNFFYDNLSSYGDWIDVGDYGYCFQPSVAVNNPDWRPYSDGYWAYTDVGWTWVSYEDFGWATYHYGRWANLESYGWVWVPGYEWGPAWVSWRTGGDYIGWAPLPPQSETVYEGRPIAGAVDVTFDIGPLYYNFVDIRYIGEPVLRQRIIPPQRNVTIINRTVNVTNITYNNSVVYNYGPNLNRLNQYSQRPVPKLALKRETNVVANAATAHSGNLNRVSNGQLMVVAPAVQKPQVKISPKSVKTTVAKPQIERGWKGVNNRQQLQAEMKKENPKNVPPPSFSPPPRYNGVMSSDGDGKWKPGAIALPKTPAWQRATPSPNVQKPVSQRNTEAAQEENAATGPRPGPKNGVADRPQSRPSAEEPAAASSQSANPREEAHPVQQPTRVAPIARTQRFEPTAPAYRNNAERAQDRPAPARPQLQPGENRPSAQTPLQNGEQAQRSPSEGVSSENAQRQAKPKKKRPDAERTPRPNE